MEEGHKEKRCLPSRAVGGGPSGIWDDHRWDTLAALHPGVITEVARGGISLLNGGRSRYLPIFLPKK